MELPEWKAIVEGLLFASGDEGLTKKQLAQMMELESKTVDKLMEALKDDYKQADRGITIMESKDVVHLTTKPEHAAYYQKLIDTPQSSRLSQAALETLAIIAYQQPITKTEIEEVRGVKSDRPIQTLVHRSLVDEVGRKEGVGRPILYGTSTDFLIYFGLTSIDELPPLPEGMLETDGEEEAELFFERFQDKLEDQE